MLILAGAGGLQAQETIPATGGNATGSGGVSNYTVGQIVYTTTTGGNGSVAQGVQQPYEIYQTSGIDDKSITLEASVYPNPTKEFLTLKIENSENISYQLFNTQGKLIESKQMDENSMTIQMEELPQSIYFLKVIKNNEIVKSFKIIKT